MKTPLLLAALLLLPLAAAAPLVVPLDVTLGHHLAPAYKHCDVAVASGANAGDVLDAAVAQGCLDSWSHDSFDGFGRFVTCIDGICQLPAGTFWAFYVDETLSDLGIDAFRPTGAQRLEFVYADWFTPFPPPI